MKPPPHRPRECWRGVSRTAVVDVSSDGWPTGPAPLQYYRSLVLEGTVTVTDTRRVRFKECGRWPRTGQAANVAAASTSRSIAKSLVVIGATSTSAQAAFPDATPYGGSINGMEIVVSDALDAGTWMVIDASAFIASSGDVELNIYDQMSIQFDTAPDSPPTAATNIVSLWQNNLVALIAERFFTVARVRSNSVAVIVGTDLGIGFSP